VARSSRDEPDRRFQSWDYETPIESTAACVPRGRARRPCHRAPRDTIAGRDEAGQAEGDGGLKRTGTSLKRTDDTTAIEASLAENAEGEKAN
jgi:hypothetical protein